jgi:branched-chain amino acid aminotransferase
MDFYVNGKFVPEDEALVSVSDHGFMYGDGCFDSLGVWDGHLIHLDDHLDRFFMSARMLRIPVPMSKPEMADLVVETARRNGFQSPGSFSMKIILTRGSRTFRLTTDFGSPTLVVACLKASDESPLNTEISSKAATISSYSRNYPAARDSRTKSLDYGISVLAFLEAMDRGAEVAILRTPDGFIAEGHMMNIFCVRNGKLLTPPAALALAGVTRKNVLDASSDLGYSWDESLLTTYDLRCADEIFVTAASLGVWAISRLDDIRLPAPHPGPLTTAIGSHYIKKAYETGRQIPS